MRNTQHAFDKGRKAYIAGKPAQSNPYTHETLIQSANFRAWAHGWRTAVENDPLLDRDEKDQLIHGKS